jgi:hypothetical protein
MTRSRNLLLSPQKFDKLTSTYGQLLSYAKQGPDIKIFLYYFLCVIINCDNFEPIPGE